MAEQLVFVDPAGVETDLTDHVDFETLWGVSGRGMPPFDFVEDELPGFPGARTRDVLVKPREVTVPVHVEAADPTALRTLLRAFAGRLNPLRGVGRLRSVAPGGDVRELACRYTGDLTLDGQRESGGVTWQRALLIFRAADDPYWRDETDTVETLTSGMSEGRTFFPFFPLRLTSSEVFSETVVDNAGQVDAWPVWTVTGPTGGVTLRNLTTGRVLALDLALVLGRVVTIDTRPGSQAVVDDAGVNLYRYLTEHDLWPLVPGENAVRVELGAVDVDTSVALSYRRRYLTA